MPFQYNLGKALADESSSFMQHAFNKLYEAIYDGTLEVGEKLPEQDLLEWLQMSRQPVRRALLHLTELGLVEMGNGRTPKVAPLDPARMNRTLLIGQMYNIYTIGKSVGNLSPEHLVRLDDAAAEVEDATRKGEHNRLAEAVDRFFRVFGESVDNAIIMAHFARMTYEVSRFLRPGASSVEPDALSAPIQALNAAARAGDRDAAVSIARQLYSLTRRNFIENYRQRES